MVRIKCPNCSSSNTCRIAYGLVELDDKLDDDLRQDKVHLGGCIVSPDDPNRHCNACDTDFDTNTPNIYLDIDGVLLANDLTPAKYAKQFLRRVLEEYPHTTYWLTTHCQGDANTPIEDIGHLFDSETVELMKRIKPTSWDLAKTRAIDFSKPFLWFDDDLFYEEKVTLLKHDVIDNLIVVDLGKYPEQLKTFLDSFPIPIEVINKQPDIKRQA